MKRKFSNDERKYNIRGGWLNNSLLDERKVKLISSTGNNIEFHFNSSDTNFRHGNGGGRVRLREFGATGIREWWGRLEPTKHGGEGFGKTLWSGSGDQRLHLKKRMNFEQQAREAAGERGEPWTASAVDASDAPVEANYSEISRARHEVRNKTSTDTVRRVEAKQSKVMRGEWGYRSA